MLYDITARIDYFFAQPSGAGRNILRLMPANLPGEQRLIAGAVTIEPAPAERSERRDFFGNALIEARFGTTFTEASFRLSARVERLAAAPALDLSPPVEQLGAEIAEVRSLGPAAPHHFLARSTRVAPHPRMTDWAREQLRPGMTALAAVAAIGRALHEKMTFVSGATTVDTDPLTAFDQKEGVCQDFSHIQIACLRGLGIPAGYVSGFLRTEPPPGQERLAGADAMHAWITAWCGLENGWIGFDPTNDMPAGVDHVRVAVGRDYDDVAPVKGVLRTSGAQDSRQEVDVIPLG